MKIIATIFWFAIAQASFFDCQASLVSAATDEAAFDLVSAAMAQDFKFSSACLEFLLRRNFIKTSKMLIVQYYHPQTQIDTSVLVNQAIRETEKRQNALLYEAIKRSRGHLWETQMAPIVFEAQSPTDIYLRVVFKNSTSDVACSASYDELVELSHKFVSLQATCFEHEEAVKYKTTF